MLDLIADNLALIMFVAMFFLIFCGFPVAYVMGGMGIVFGYIGYLLGVFPFTSLSNVILRMWGGCCRRSRSGLDPDVHFHGIHP